MNNNYDSNTEMNNDYDSDIEMMQKIFTCTNAIIFNSCLIIFYIIIAIFFELNIILMCISIVLQLSCIALLILQRKRIKKKNNRIYEIMESVERSKEDLSTDEYEEYMSNLKKMIRKL